MTQFAVLKRLTGPDRAEVEVLRGTACGGDCGSCEACHYTSKIRVEARNDIGAQPGDRVEIEARTSKVLGAAVRAEVTVTFHRAKHGHMLFPGRALSGRDGGKDEKRRALNKSADKNA